MKKTKQKNIGFKRLTVMLIVILLMFAAYNLVWYFLKYQPYHRLCADFQKSDEGLRGERYSYSDTDYTYSIKMPAYLSFEGGFISVSSNKKISQYAENGAEVQQSSCTIFIWPQIMKETKYGAAIFEQDNSYMLYIDKGINYVANDGELPSETKSNEEIISNHYNEISEIMNAVDKMWGDI